MSLLQANMAGLGGSGAPGGALAGGAIFGYKLNQSLRFDGTSAYLNFTPSSSTTGTVTISAWVKRSNLGVTQYLFASGAVNARGNIGFNTSDQLFFQGFNSSGANSVLTSSMLFRDTSSWYHIVIECDGVTTTSNFPTNTSVYVNGSTIAMTHSTASTPSGGFRINDTQVKHIGALTPTASSYLSGYMAEIHWIDGIALDANNFGETVDGIWQPKEYTGSHGTAGWYLPFSQDETTGASAFFDEDDNSYVAWTDPGTEYVIGSSDDYTIELFFNPTTTEMSGNSYIAGYYKTTTPSGYFAIQTNLSSRNFYLYHGNGAAYTFGTYSVGDVVAGQWHHLAFNRSSGTLRCFLDGAEVGSAQLSNTKTHDIPEFRVNKAHATSNTTFDGYISNVRLVIGSAVYADGSSITVPTSTLTAVTNTKILACTTTTITADASSNNVTGTANGTAGSGYFGSNVSPFATSNFYEDASSNTNDWAANDAFENDVVPDSPTNNMAVLSSVNKYTNASADDVREGGLEERGNSSGYAGTVTFDATDTNGYYFEVTHTGTPGGGCTHGMMNFTDSINQYGGVPGDSDRSGWWGVYRRGSGGGNTFWYYLDGVQTGDLGVAGSANDVWMYLIKDGKFYIGRNGTWFNSGNPSAGTGYYDSGLTGTDWTIFSGNGYNVTGGHTIRVDRNLWDHGDASYKEVKASNIADPTIGPGQSEQADDYFETILYTGNGSGQSIGSGGVQHPQDTTTIANSLRFNDDDSNYFSKTTGSDGNRQIWTFSAWVKRGNFPSSTIQTIFSEGSSSTSFAMHVYDNTFYVQERSGGSNRFVHQTNAIAGAAGTWYHLVYAVDTTQATDTDRVKLYVNGALQTLNQISSNAIYPTLNLNTNMNFGSTHYIGYGSTQNKYWDGYLAEVYMIDGQQLEPTTFGQVGSNGYWIPKAVSGLTFGDEGYYLDFEDNSSASALGTDDSGIGNNFTPSTNIATTDQVIDSPTQNFATLDPNTTGMTGTLSEGNLKVVTQSTGSDPNTQATFGISSGKWYWEAYLNNTSVHYQIGITRYQMPGYADISSGSEHQVIARAGAGATRVDTADVETGITAAVAGDIIGFALDMDNKTMQFYNNGSAFGAAVDFSHLDNFETVTPWIVDTASSVTVTATYNFGADDTFVGSKTSGSAAAADGNGYGSFYYTPPTDYLALVDDNIPQEGLASPDFVWIKERNNSSKSHYLFDTIRGATKNLHSDDTPAEATDTDSLLSFDKQGFTVGSNGDVNGSADTYVAWNWKAGGPKPTQTYTLTVGNDSGQNKYLFDGNAEYAPTISLQEGGTYTFDWSGANTHPFSFSTTSDGTWGGGTEYTVGVVKDTSAYTTKITVAHGAPTLYYYCSSHSGMGGQVNTTTTHGSTNFKGSIRSIVSANQDAGFSIATFTMTSGDNTIGHGLGKEPDLLIFKRTDATASWVVWARPFGENTKSNLLLDGTGAATTPGTGNWIQNITDTLVGIGDYGNMAAAGTHIMYAFASIEGYSKVGSYIGNGIADGTFVYTGFRPAWVMVRRSSSTGGWHIFDNKRPNPFNEIDQRLEADNADAENSTSGCKIDLVSNGFKFRGNFDNINGNGNTHIYLAFAEQPFKFANAR